MQKHKRQQLQKANRPKQGASIKVEPIRDLAAIARIKAILANQPRNRCLFILGINTAYRANELLMLNITDVKHLGAGDTLEIKQSKNQRYRKATLNGAATMAIKNWLQHHPLPKLSHHHFHLLAPIQLQLFPKPNREPV